MEKALGPLLERIWQERINQKIDASLVLFEILKKKMGFSLSQILSEAPALHQMSPTLACELLALESSLSRAQRMPELSRRALAWVDQAVPYQIQITSFALQFERAVTAFAVSDWARALEFFQRANILVRNDMEKCACLANLILCLENLEIPFQQTLNELNALLLTMTGTLADGIRSQIECLHLREQWRQMDFSFLRNLQMKDAQISQSTYFRVYLAQNPYLAVRAPRFSVEEFVKQPGHLFNKDFRLRTLTLQALDQDVSLGRISDFIERLYLGTWKWMSEPTESRLQFLISAFKHFPWVQLETINQLSVEDQSLLLLSLGWLSLFDVQIEALALRLNSKLRMTERNQTLIAERSAQLELAGRPGANLATLLKQEILKRVRYKADRIENEHIAPTDLITVDYAKNQIQVKGRTRMQSRAITLALKNLKLAKTLSLERFFASLNSHIEFDQYIHQAQVSNLIYKINQLIGPELRVRQKEGMVILTGNEQCLSLINFDHRFEMLATESEWQRSLRNFRNIFEAIQEAKGFSIKRSFITVSSQMRLFSRNDVQFLLKISKSESHRMIALWLNRRWIEKTGHGKRTQYRVKMQTEKTG